MTVSKKRSLLIINQLINPLIMNLQKFVLPTYGRRRDMAQANRKPVNQQEE